MALVLPLVIGCGPQTAGTGVGSNSTGSGLAPVRPGLATALTVPKDYVATPHGYYHKSCVHTASTTEAFALRTTPCDYPRVLIRSASTNAPDTTEGWVEDSSYTAPAPMTKMTSTFVVPTDPITDQGQLVYFFPGAEPADGSIIIQPVLAWGTNPAGGGSYWSATSWSCGASCVHGNLVQVKAGDKISGTITGSNCTTTGSCDWDIETKDTTSGAVASLKTTNDSEPYVWLFSGVLEAYGVAACNQFPAAGDIKFSYVKFYNQAGKLIAPTWGKETIDSSLGCGYGIKTTKETSTLSFVPAKGGGDGGTGGGIDFSVIPDLGQGGQFDLGQGGQFDLGQGGQYDLATVDLSEGDGFSGTFDGGNSCQYSCADYGFTAGQCYSDWLCGSNGCLTQVTSCP